MDFLFVYFCVTSAGFGVGLVYLLGPKTGLRTH